MQRFGIMALVLLACGSMFCAVKSWEYQAHSRLSTVADLPPGFAEEEIARGLTGAVAMDVAPDGRVFVCEQTGALRVVKDDVLQAEPFVTVKVDSAWER